MNTQTETLAKRFITVDDGGCDYVIVARDVEHAKQILRDHGVEFTDEEGDSHPIDHPAFADLEWKEMNADWVATCNVWDEERGEDGRVEQKKVPLASREVGAFFSSEW